MFDVATEQIIKVKAPKAALFYKIIMIAACVLAATTIPGIGVWGVLLVILFIVATILVFDYYNAEYEYSLVDDTITVDKIMSRTVRKRCGEYNIARAKLVANYGSQDALRMEHMDLRTCDYTSNVDDEAAVVIYTYNGNNELTRIFIEPDEKMFEAIKLVATKDAFKAEFKGKKNV